MINNYQPKTVRENVNQTFQRRFAIKSSPTYHIHTESINKSTMQLRRNNARLIPRIISGAVCALTSRLNASKRVDSKAIVLLVQGRTNQPDPIRHGTYS